MYFGVVIIVVVVSAVCWLLAPPVYNGFFPTRAQSCCLYCSTTYVHLSFMCLVTVVFGFGLVRRLGKIPPALPSPVRFLDIFTYPSVYVNDAASTQHPDLPLSVFPKYFCRRRFPVFCSRGVSGAIANVHSAVTGRAGGINSICCRGGPGSSSAMACLPGVSFLWSCLRQCAS